MPDQHYSPPGEHEFKHRVITFGTILVKYAQKRYRLDRFYATEADKITAATMQEATQEIGRMRGSYMSFRTYFALSRAHFATHRTTGSRVWYILLWLCVSLPLFLYHKIARLANILFWAMMLVGRRTKCWKAHAAELAMEKEQLRLLAMSKLQMSRISVTVFV